MVYTTYKNLCNWNISPPLAKVQQCAYCNMMLHTFHLFTVRYYETSSLRFFSLTFNRCLKKSHAYQLSACYMIILSFALHSFLALTLSKFKQKPSFLWAKWTRWTTMNLVWALNLICLVQEPLKLDLVAMFVPITEQENYE